MKYLAWIDGDGYWEGHQLVSLRQMNTVRRFLDPSFPVFTSIQTYSESGEILSCPIYFDLDGDPESVLRDARDLANQLTKIAGIPPFIAFSGNKGFHITLPYSIKHKHCHEIVRIIAKDFELSTLDLNVYTARRYWRCMNSPGSKKGFFKIQLSRDELFHMEFEDFRPLATKPRNLAVDFSLTDFNRKALNELVLQAIEKFSRQPLRSTGGFLSVEADITPCIKTLFDTEPRDGEWNRTIFLLVRFLRRCGLNEADTEAYFLTYPHWVSLPRNEIRKVIRSTFRNRNPSGVGCKSTSPDAELMLRHCDALCQYNEDFPDPFSGTTT